MGCELHFGRLAGAAHERSQRLIPWCVQYAGQLITRTNLNAEGRTAWTEITGRREVPRKFIPWGDKVQYIPGGGKAKPGIQAKWLEGIFLAFVDRSNEYLIGTPEGVVKSSNAKRLTKADARDPELFVSIRAQPWKLSDSAETGERHDDVPVRLSVIPRVPVTELPRAARGPEAEPRRVYIRRNVELDRYGYTPGCPGCIAAETNAAPTNHSAECRARIEAAMSADDLLGGRVEAQAAKRQRVAEETPAAGRVNTRAAEAMDTTGGAQGADGDTGGCRTTRGRRRQWRLATGCQTYG